MRWSLILPAVAIIVVAFAALLMLGGDDAPIDEVDEDKEWHQASSIAVQMGFCGDCHYGMEEMWNAAWTADDDLWTLQVSPRFPEAPLYGVQVLPADTGPVAGDPIDQTAQMAWGDVMTATLDVPDDATGVLVRFHGAPPEALPPELAVTYNQPNDYATTLAVVAPDGTRHDVQGPEEDLKIGVFAGDTAMAGQWRIEASIASGEFPVATGVLHAEALRGQIAPELSTLADTWSQEYVADPDGAPPAVTLRLWPYHDHAEFENTDWDSMDSTPFAVTYTPTTGPAPSPRTWNETAIDALWDGDTERVVLDRSGSRQDIYVQEPGHNDPGLGGSYPSFGPLGDPVWPGTATARFDLSWEPAVEAPDFKVRFSPANTVYFFEPEELERSPGQAVFEIAVQPAWWEEPDQVLAWLDPDQVTSYWDIASYWDGAEGEPQLDISDWHLRVTTNRAVTPG